MKQNHETAKQQADGVKAKPAPTEENGEAKAAQSSQSEIHLRKTQDDLTIATEQIEQF